MNWKERSDSLQAITANEADLRHDPSGAQIPALPPASLEAWAGSGLSAWRTPPGRE